MNHSCAAESEGCARLLRQGRDVITDVAQSDYAFSPEAGVWASPGAHLRHVIDYFDCLFTGIDAKTIDYTARRRCLDAERSREAGIRELDRCIELLEKLSERQDRTRVEVRCDEGDPWVGSTLARELRFAASHTVHHFALIRLTLAHRGIATPAEFGVSPSTLAHRAREQATRSAGPDHEAARHGSAGTPQRGASRPRIVPSSGEKAWQSDVSMI